MKRQDKSKSKHGEGSNRKREHPRDPSYQREQGRCSNPCYSNFYPSAPKHHHKCRTPTNPKEPKVDLFHFDEKDNAENI